MKKISIIIPAYNAEKHIEECILSILNQDFIDYEIIIVNDASKDNTLDRCQKLNNNIKIINLSENKGVSNARNIGIENAEGEYIHFVDSDDSIEKNFYKNIIEEIKTQRKDIIITGTRYNEDGEIRLYESNRCNINTLQEMKSFIQSNCISGRRDIFNVVWNKFYKREFILKNNIKFEKDINLGEDFLFNLECMKRTNSIYVSSIAGYNYMRRKNEQTLKMNFIKNKIELRRLFYKKWIEFYKYYDIYETVAEEMEIYEGYKIYVAILSVTGKNCPLSYKEKVEYIKEFTEFENSNCLFKYLEQENKLEKQYLSKGEIEKFYNIVKNMEEE